MEDIAHFELALRNAYAGVLCDDLGKGRLLDEDSPLRRPIIRMSKAKIQRDVNLVNRRAIDDARRRAHNERLFNPRDAALSPKAVDSAALNLLR